MRVADYSVLPEDKDQYADQASLTAVRHNVFDGPAAVSLQSSWRLGAKPWPVAVRGAAHRRSRLDQYLAAERASASDCPRHSVGVIGRTCTDRPRRQYPERPEYGGAVVVGGDVVEYVIYHPESLGAGAAFATAMAPTITIPAMPLPPKSLSIMVHTPFRVRDVDARIPQVRCRFPGSNTFISPVPVEEQ